MLTNKKTNNQGNLRDLQKVFLDGVVEVYNASERQLGNLLGSFYYCEESVGVSAYWQAHANNVKVDKAISIPLSPIVITNQDVCKIGGVFYAIVRTQVHDNKKPEYITLNLQKAVFNYEVQNDTI